MIRNQCESLWKRSQIREEKRKRQIILKCSEYVQARNRNRSEKQLTRKFGYDESDEQLEEVDEKHNKEILEK